MNQFADGLKDLINTKASKKFFSAVRAGFALKFFIKQEEKFLAGVKEKKVSTVELNEDGTPKNLEFRPIDEYQLNRNEYVVNGKPKPPFVPRPLERTPDEPESSDET